MAEGGAAGTIGEAFVEIRPELSRFFSEISGGLKSAAEGAVDANSGAMSKLASVGEIAVASLAAGFAVVAVASLHAADTFEVAHAQLENAVKNTGGNMDELSGKVKSLEKEFENYGYTNAATETALTKLTQATHDPALAIQDLGVAANIAAGRHMDLGAASQLLSRVLQGNYGVLVRLGVATRDQVKDIHSQQEAIDLLNKTYGGSAAAAADTFAGKQAALKAKIEDLEKSIGLLLIPTLETLATAAGNTIDFFEKNTTAAAALGIVLGGPLAAAIAAFILQEAKLVAVKIFEFFENVAKFAINAATAIAAAAEAVYAALGPIGLLIAGATALALVFGRTSDAAAKAGKAFAEGFVTEANKSADSTAILKQRIADLAAEQQRLIVTETAHLDSSGKVNINILEQSKAFLNAGAAGKTLEDQYQHNRAEIKRYQEELKKNEDAQKSSTDAMKAAKEAGVPLAAQQETLAISAQDLADSTHISADAVTALAQKMKIDLTKATEDQNTQLEEAATRLSFTSESALKLHDDFVKLADVTSTATDKTAAFKDALDQLIGKNIDAEKAVVNFQGTIDGLSAKLRTNKDSFDATTQAGRDNITMVEDAVTKIRDHVEALQAQNAGADAVRGAFDGDTAALRNQLTQAGLTKDQVDKLIASYNLVPSALETVIKADLSPAEAALRQYAQDVQALGNSVASLKPGQAPVPVPRFAGGGYTGEGGGIVDPHELVLPLDNPAAMARAFAQVPSRYRGQFAGVSGGGGGGITQNNTFVVPAGVSPDDYARAMGPAFEKSQRELLHLMRSGAGVRG